jgi:osmotically-inducible protein OsmY
MRRWTFLGLTLLLCGCGKDADRLSRMCNITGAKLAVITSGARAKVKNGFQAVRGETGVDSRVATRLRWDKEMDGADVRVQMTDGVLQLDGTVVSAEQQQRAVELASATTGVDRIESKLTVKEK